MTTDPILDALQRKGTLINLTVRYWRGRKKLKPEDLGLDPDRIDDRLISLGQKRLVCADELAPFRLIEGRAHAAVDAASFPFLRVARFVPNARLEDLLSKLAELEGEFERQAATFVAGYADTRARALDTWRDVADGLADDPDRLLRTIEEAFPLNIARHFAFEHQLFQITAPRDVQLAAFDAAESAAVGEARRKAALEAQESIRRSAEEFVSESVAALRAETAQLCEEMLQTIGGGKVNQRTLNRLSTFVDRFRSLNFVGDAEMERRLEEVKQVLLSQDAAGYRKNGSADLVTGLRSLRDQAREMAAQDTKALVERFGEVGRRKFAGVA